MTRVTKLARKRFLEPSGFQVEPLKPAPQSDAISTTKPARTVNLKEKEKKALRRKVKRQHNKLKVLICFACRGTGHLVSNCPAALESLETTQKEDKTLCYRCGSTSHSVGACKKVANQSNRMG